jgi:hypothetical protein
LLSCRDGNHKNALFEQLIEFLNSHCLASMCAVTTAALKALFSGLPEFVALDLVAPNVPSGQRHPFGQAWAKIESLYLRERRTSPSLLKSPHSVMAITEIAQSVMAITAESERGGRIALNKHGERSMTAQLFLLALGFFFTMAGILAAAEV